MLGSINIPNIAHLTGNSLVACTLTATLKLDDIEDTKLFNVASVGCKEIVKPATNIE